VAKRVLIVEDDADTRHMLADILTGRGYDVDMAFDGTQAVARLSQPPPDLVTLDMNMPIVDGEQVLERMRATSGWSQVPVLVLSGAVKAPEWVLTTRAAGFLSKPFTLDELTRAVERLAPTQVSLLPKRM
jgi:two-component system KDP operon response regulator KdpE